jgi:hypothetical protein
MSFTIEKISRLCFVPSTQPMHTSLGFRITFPTSSFRRITFTLLPIWTTVLHKNLVTNTTTTIGMISLLFLIYFLVSYWHFYLFFFWLIYCILFIDSILTLQRDLDHSDYGFEWNGRLPNESTVSANSYPNHANPRECKWMISKRTLALSLPGFLSIFVGE